MKKVLVAFVVIGAGIAGSLFALRSHSVLYRYFETGNPIHEPAFAVFNPLRDRQTGRTAEEFLTQLKTGACASMVREPSTSPEFQQQTCEHETTNHIISLRLRNRTDEPSKVRLYFVVSRKYRPDLESQLWVTVESNGPTWRVTDYDRYY